ncbi:MAG TPA: LysR family transcriptional regulator [Saprospiraceae bacterium]|nr:LysR family transcriptional regulator [Saprospiraceae bacterium]
MNYTLHQLNVFLSVVDNQSITKAAEALHLTQPAVSIQLKKLQEQFKIPLTELVGKKLYITDFGREIAGVARAIIDQAEAIEHKALAYQGQLYGKIKIAVVSTGKYVIPYFLTDFFKQHPGVELIIDVTNKSRVLESLKENEVDIALVSILPELMAVDSTSLISNKLYLVANADYAVKKTRNIQDFFDELPLIYREQGSGTRQTMERFIQQLKVPIRRKMALTSNEAVKQAVLAGLGLSIMPLIGIKNELKLGQLKIIPVKGLPIQTEWQLIWLSGKKHSVAVDAFLKHVDQQKESIINSYFDWYEAY